jgi:hypothetical protein
VFLRSVIFDLGTLQMLKEMNLGGTTKFSFKEEAECEG